MNRNLPDQAIKPCTLIDILRWRALHQADTIGYTFLPNGETGEITLTYGELDRQARAIASTLNKVIPAGGRALLLYPAGLEYIAAFFGCLYAGVVAVPSYPPRLRQANSQFEMIVEDAEATVALTNTRVIHNIKRRSLGSSAARSFHWVPTDEMPAGIEDNWHAPEVAGDTLAYLQYTSGSTSAPKGVMVNNSNLMHNLAFSHQSLGITPASRGVIWVPPYHDLGLIGGILFPLYAGFPVTLMSPFAFLQYPLRWLQAISRTKASLSAAPNFAYDLCIRKITGEQKAALDLSSWDVALVGAEPIRHETLEEFAKTFAPCGFRPQALYPAYGLAEATVMVTGGERAAKPITLNVEGAAMEEGRVIVSDQYKEGDRIAISCGQASVDHKIIIVDPTSLTRCQADEVGEIWIAGPSVAQGYWNKPEETRRTFQGYLADTGEGPFLRSGDLGFLKDDDLFVTGRLKDLIIIRGRNYYPQDIELSVGQSHPSLPAHRGAAFSVDMHSEERLVIVQEVDRHYRPEDEAEIVKSIHAAVANDHELQPYAVILLKPASLPMTSSGKVRRQACRAGFLTDTLESVGQSVLDDTPAAFSGEILTREMLLLTAPEERQEVLEKYLQQEIARRVKITPAQLDPQRTLVRLGLDSLMAVEMQNYLEAQLGVVVPAERLLADMSIYQFVKLVLDQLDNMEKPAQFVQPFAPQSPLDSADHQVDNTLPGGQVIASLQSRIPRTPSSQAFFPASPGQQALWFIQQLAPESTAYHLSFAVHIHSRLDTSALGWALQALHDRHATLRTTFTAQDGVVVQRIDEKIDIHFEAIDAASWDEGTLEKRLVEEARQPFDLEQGPLLRVYLFTRAEQEHILSLNVHHIAVDALSLVVLLDELIKLYVAAREGEQFPLPPLDLQYTDYALWQTEVLAGREGERLRSYWQKQLAGDLPVLDLPSDRIRPAVQTYHGATHFFTVEKELTRQLKALAQAEGTTLYTTLLAIFNTLLFRYSGQEDIVVGSPIVGRSKIGFEALVGYFINAIVLRTDLANNPTFKTFLGQVRQAVLAALAHRDYPFPLLVERLQPLRDPSRSPLFQVMFNMPRASRLEDAGVLQAALSKNGVQMQLGGLSLEILMVEQQAAMFDLTLTIMEVGESLSASFQYNTDLFDSATIVRMEGHLQSLLRGVVNNPEQSIANLPLLTAAEQHQSLIEWNNTCADFPSTACFHQLFEAQVQQTPDIIAAVCENEHLSYDALNRQANQIAHSLVQLGVQPGVIVAVLAERSLELLTAIIAVFKAGGAYLPLEPGYPDARVREILSRSETSLVLTTNTFAASLAQTLANNARANEPRILDIGELLQQAQANSTDMSTPGQASYKENLPARCTPGDLAYVIYTSGSTGLPKGVMIEQRGMLNHLYAKIADLQLTGTDSVAQTASQSFDISIWQFLAVLLVGGRVHIFRDEVAHNPLLLLEQTASNKLTIWETVPSLLRAILEELEQGRMTTFALPWLRWLILTGEALPPELCHQWLNHYPAIPLLNAYGPTECSDDVTHYPLHLPPHKDVARIPIGRPIINTQLYILDAQLQPVPVGVKGELYVGGTGVGRGYLHDAQQTSEAFMPDPFAREPGSRMYKTGDVARYLSDGNIEFLGRVDHQVKIRGFRIELGEIEAVLRQHPAIEESLVMAREDEPNEKRLVAYVVGNNNSVPAARELHDFLKEKVPDYMVPSLFVLLDAFPLTNNGKINRRALPVPETAISRLEETFVAPRNRNEEILASIWTAVLGRERVGIHNNFFELGGDSIQSIQVISRAKQAGLRLTPKQLLQNQTIAELARVIDTAPDSGAEQGLVSGPVPLTPIQHWFFEQNLPEPHHFNRAVMVEASQNLDLTLLEKAFSQLLIQHDALRLRFIKDASGWQQESIDRAEEVQCIRVDLSARSETEQEAAINATIAELHTSLDLCAGPLLRVAFFKLGNNQADRLVLIIHHLVIDAVSWRILLEDLLSAYEQLSHGRAVQLPAKTTSFKQWAWQLADLAQSPATQEELDYWLALPWGGVSRLPIDYDDGENTEMSARTLWISLGTAETTSLFEKVLDVYNTQINDVLLATLGLALAHWTKSPFVLVDMERHGREELFNDVDVSRTVGWFTAIFPILLSLQAASNIAEALQVVREHLQGIPNGGTGYGLLRYLNENEEIRRQLRLLPQAEVSFNYLGKLDQVQSESSFFGLFNGSIGYFHSPRGTRRYILDINASVVEGKLLIAWTYSENLHARETIEALLEDFLKTLQSLLSS